MQIKIFIWKQIQTGWNVMHFFFLSLKQIGGDKVSERESHLKIMMLLGGQC